MFYFFREQMKVLHGNGRLKTLQPNGTPMIMLKDVTRVLRQLENLVNKNNEQEQLLQMANASKRQRKN